MQINMTINSEELIEAASKMPIDEKLRLFEKIQDDIFEYKFKEILDNLQTDQLSEEDILKEVEYVRSERYKNNS
jgi:pheromone shutdown protein TraB